MSQYDQSLCLAICISPRELCVDQQPNGCRRELVKRERTRVDLGLGILGDQHINSLLMQINR